MPRFVVLRTVPGLPEPRPPPNAYVLRPDALDDGGLRTTFHLAHVAADRSETPIGSVKIVVFGQVRGETTIPTEFPELGPDYASLGAELQYYERLKSVAGSEAGVVLEALGDIATDPARRARFEAQIAVKASLLRFTPARTALEEAAAVFVEAPRARFTAEGAGLQFHTSTGGTAFSFRLVFEAVPELPGRINVLVGPNGSGKTRLLANLALAAFDPAPILSPDRPWGSMDDGLSISRILAFSYSAFDDFDVPGVGEEKSDFLRTGADLGYSYFGLRDLVARSALGDDAQAPLKGPAAVAAEFESALAAAASEDPDLLRRALSELFSEASLSTMGLLDQEEIRTLDAPALVARLRDIFPAASTGHKFVLIMTAQLAANVRPGALVLIDEPEAHLHPPLLAVFLRVLRTVVDHHAAWGIIATHSPFIVQETPARYVHIVTRHVTEASVRPPEIETFGEDVGTITREVFRLDTRGGEYVELLRTLAERFTLDELEDLFEYGLSSQARSLVMSHQRRARG